MMENLKSEPFDEREEGEISLDDVSSSEEIGYDISSRNVKKSGLGKIHIKRENGILAQDADYGKENRQYSNELISSESKPIIATLQEKNEDLLPISSDENIEFVGLPGTSKQLVIHLGPKKKHKKKRKKKSGQRMLVLDDLVSTFDDEPDVLGIVTDDRRDFIVSKPYGNSNFRSLSPIHRVDSPQRHVGWHLSRSPTKHYYSPLKHGRSPNHRSPSPRHRSPRKFLSPRKPSTFNSDRRILHKSSRDLSPGRYNDAYATSLLKKVRHLETVGSITQINQQKYKESSLKEKLNKMMIKSEFAVKENVDNQESNIGDRQDVTLKTDDDEDLEFLRRKALETKQLKNNNKSDEINSTNNAASNIEGNINVSDDEEDLQLRMIALRSAVMKKHYDRVRRGIIKKKSDRDIKNESPSRDSLLDSLDSDFDEIDNDNQKIVSPVVHVSNVGNARIEDMDLDSDIEREKEYNEPYSPTDEFLNQTLIEQVPPNEETSFDQISTPDVERNLSTTETSQYSDNFTHFQYHTSITSSPYSPWDPMCTPQIDRSSKQESTTMLRDPRLRRHNNAVTEMPYSPNNPAVFNPTVPMCPAEISFARPSLNTNINSRSSNLSNLISVPLENHPNILPSMVPAPFQNIIAPSIDSNITNKSHEMEKINAKEVNINDKVQNNMMYNDIVRDLADYTGEPLYLQGVPDVTKDVNKIPTLVNRTLVPVPILKTNKKLQQPLPNKKLNGNDEPTFKSAEMIPVNLQSQSSSPDTGFKPIKLPLVTKKSPLINTPAAAFDTTLIDESGSKTTLDNNCELEHGENPDIPVDKSCKDTGNSEVLNQPQSNVMPPNQLKTKVRRLKMNRNKAEIVRKSSQKNIECENSITNVNEKINDKIKVKRPLKTQAKKESVRKNEKSTEEVKKTDVDITKNKDVKKSDSKKGKNVKSVTNFENKSDENSINNFSTTKISTDSSSIKQKKDGTKKVLKTKTTKNLETNPKKTSLRKIITTKSDDKKRRCSIDEDEEALRAALLASLPKRKKSSDSQSSAISSDLNIVSSHLAKKKSCNTKETSKEKSDAKTTSMLPPTTALSRSVNKSKIADQNKTAVKHINNKDVAKKRLSTETSQGPMEKIMKNTITPSINAAKMLNAAEKFIDNEIQRKLALQQAAIDLLSNKTSQNMKTNPPRPAMNDTKVSMTSKISASRSLERVIIRFDEDSDSDSNGHNEESPEMNTSDVSSQEISKTPVIPTTDFEKSVEEFLRSQREKQESSKTMTTIPAVKPSIATSQKQTSTITSTPLAVRHLPASKQEEYRRLKQRIAEREQQKLNRPIQSTMKNRTQTPSSNESPSATPVATTSAVVNENISNIEMHPQDKTDMQSIDEKPPIVSDQQYTPISIRTQITPIAMELLQSTMKTDSTEVNNVTSTPLLTDVPIKTEPLSLETTPNLPDSGLSVNVNISNNYLNEDNSNSSSIGPVQLKEKLFIHFPNTNDNNYARHITINKNNDVFNEQANTSQITTPGLRILTSDQLNTKLECVHSDTDNNKTQIEDQKPILNQSVQINNDLPGSHNVIERNDVNLADSNITIETCKIESNSEIIEPSDMCYQNIVKAESLTNLSNLQHESMSNTNKNVDIDATIESDLTIVLDVSTLLDEFETIVDSVADSKINIKSELPDRGEEPLEKIETDLQTQLENLYKLSEHEQQVQLTTLEKELVAKRYAVVHHLAQLDEDLQQWKIQADLDAEVRKLRIQLQVAEERLQAQRAKIVDIHPQTTHTQTIINEGREECMKLSKLCQEVGSKVIGATYKIPMTAGQLLKEKLREVSNMTKQLSKKKAPPTKATEGQNHQMLTQPTSCNFRPENVESNMQPANCNFEMNQHSTMVKIEDVDPKPVQDDETSNASTETLICDPIQDGARVDNEVIGTTDNNALFSANDQQFNSQPNAQYNEVSISVTDNTQIKTEDENPPIQPAVSYESVLTVSNTPRHMDPNGVLCPYELMGTCSDEACPYNHIDANRS